MIDKWQTALQANTEATERWTKRLLYASVKLTKLRAERKRLLARGKGKKIVNRKLEDIPRMAAGGNEFNDEIPI